MPRRLRRLRLAAHPETIAATLAEVERCTRRGATINVFMLDDDPRLVRFMRGDGRRNGGRVFLPDSGALGEYVVADYLRARRGQPALRDSLQPDRFVKCDVQQAVPSSSHTRS